MILQGILKKIYSKALRCKTLLLPRTPRSRLFGFDRGMPIDRYYIESFLAKHAVSIKGSVLEIAEDTYSRKFGGTNISTMHILNLENSPGTTMIGNLETGAGIPEADFDCMVLTQTLPFIYDYKSALENSFKALRTGGVLLATLPCISQISRHDMDRWGDYWRFTDLSARKVFEDVFGAGNVEISIYGNYYAAICFLSGLAVKDISCSRLAPLDSDYQLIIGIRAVKR